MINIHQISFNYPGSSAKIFSNFSLQLNDNNIYGLLGKNGTGKSTLLYLISGLLHARKGSITIDGTDTSLRLPQVLSEMFIVPEELDLPDTSLDEYVMVNSPFYPRFSREVLESCLNDFELPSNIRLNSLSMGQKKKVFMSFALAAGTRLMLMDEPTNGLDIPSKAQFRRVVASHMTPQRMLIISTHQVHDVEQLLDHVIMLDRGGLLLDASVAELCQRYTFEYRMPGQPMDDVLYCEPTLQGNAVIAPRQENSGETPLNLELLFNYITTKHHETV